MARGPQLRLDLPPRSGWGGARAGLIFEADDASALASGMKSISGRIAKGLNRLMRRAGRVFTDRYHAHVLRTPGEVRNAIAYVVGNFASHAHRRGEWVDIPCVDPCSSSAAVRTALRHRCLRRGPGCWRHAE
jgi:hypothetical protein